MSFISAATGKDASNNAGKAQANATAYNNQAAPLYGALGTEGANNTSIYNNNIMSALQTFATAAGLPSNFAGPTSNTANSGQNTATSKATPATTAGATQRAPTGQPGASTGQSGSTAQTAQAPLPPQVAAYAAQNGSFDPYQLDSNGQMYVASMIDQANQQTTSLIQQFNTNMAESGIKDSEANASGATIIRQQQMQTLNADIAQFVEQQQQVKISAAGNLLGAFQQIGSAGAQETGAAGSGYAGMAAEQTGASIQEQNLANQQMAGIGSFLGSYIPGGAAAQNLGNYGIGSSSGNYSGTAIQNAVGL